MGALEINPRKRDAAYTSFNHKLDSPISQLYSDTHFSKKPRFSPQTPNSTQDRRVSLKSTASRVLEYPEKITRFKRPVHAPCKSKKFKVFKASSDDFNDVTKGNIFSNYVRAKKEAFATFRFCGNGKEVIDVDDDIEVIDTDNYNNIDVEEVEIVKKGKEKLWGCDGEVRELDKVVEEPNCQPSCSSVTSEVMVSGNLKLEDVNKGLEIVSINPELDGYEGPLHDKLKKSVEKGSGKLGMLAFMIDLLHRKLLTLQLYRPAKKPVKDVDGDLFVPLTDEEENEVSLALSNAKRRMNLVTHQESNIEITGELLRCLRPGAWLNDEVINMYLVLLKEREQRESQKFLKCHFFSTFFYKKLIGGRSGYDYKSVRRWTTQRKLGYCLVECDKIFVPIHQEIHWCLGVINKKDEKFQYLDSLRGRDKQVMTVLARYYVDEVKDKSGKDIDVSSWKQEFVEDLPEQQNGYDCGVFMIKYSDFYSRDVGLCFTQEHMPYFRRRTAKEILRLKAD